MSLPATLAIAAIGFYRYALSPMKTFLFGPMGRCRFSPSCSEYGIEAIHTHGFIRGLWLAGGRVCRCHPLGGSGFDPVPPLKNHF